MYIIPKYYIRLAGKFRDPSDGPVKVNDDTGKVLIKAMLAEKADAPKKEAKKKAAEK